MTAAWRKYSGKPSYADCLVCESARMASDANNTQATDLSDAYRSLIVSQLKNTKARHDAWREWK